MIWFRVCDRSWSARAGALALAVCALVAASGCARHRVTEVSWPGGDPASCVPAGWPVTHPQPVISSPFGDRKDPYTGRRKFHAGVDIVAPKGAPVVATAHGQVAATHHDPGGYGYYVLIDHGNGYHTRYAHLRRFLVGPGARVARYEPIGEVGASGNATGPHVHYEVLLRGNPIDPRPYLPR